MKPIVTSLAIAAIAGGMLVLSDQSSSWLGVLFVTPFSLGPLFVTAGLSARIEKNSPQVLLLISTILYSAWFAFVYLDAFYWHLDPQSAVALMFVGIYSLPVMIPLWLAAWFKRQKGITPSQS